MSPAILLADLVARGVEFQAVGDKLRLRPVELLTPDELMALRQHKAKLLKLLASSPERAAAAWPIIPGHEHFSLWVDSAEGRLPEFMPGYHYDIRQPSRLQPLLGRINGVADQHETSVQEP